MLEIIGVLALIALGTLATAAAVTVTAAFDPNPIAGVVAAFVSTIILLIGTLVAVFYLGFVLSHLI